MVVKSEAGREQAAFLMTSKFSWRSHGLKFEACGASLKALEFMMAPRPRRTTPQVSDKPQGLRPRV